MTNNSITSREPKISPEALALLGGGKIAYVKMVRSEDVRPSPTPGARSSRPSACTEVSRPKQFAANCVI